MRASAGGIRLLPMREFGGYTAKAGRARRFWLLFLPVVAALLGVGALALAGLGEARKPVELLGYEGTGAAEARAAGVPGVPINVLVVGLDERPDTEAEGVRSDTIMVVRVDPRDGSVKLLSVPRDLLVEVADGREEKVNAAFARGGIAGAEDVIEHHTGIPIDNTVAVDFEGFEKVISTIGGVKVDVEPGFPEKFNLEPGLRHLGGRKALLYARYRGTTGGDIDRMERQQQLVAALRSKALRWSAVKKLPEVVRVASKHVETDLTVREAFALGRVLIRHGRDARMSTSRLAGTPETLEDGSQVLVPDGAANAAIIAEFRE